LSDTPNKQSRILIAEDDSGLRTNVRRFLEQAGYRVLEAGDGLTAIQLATDEKPALIVMDVVMPGLDGVSVTAELRRLGHTTPILLLTSRTEVNDRVQGLNAGADDYLGKPFDSRELIARVVALLRREHRQEVRRQILHFGGIEVNLDTKTAQNNGAPLTLTRTEFAILEFLASCEGAPVSRERMLDAVWGYTYFPSTRTVDTHIWRLRKKLGDDGDNPRWLRKVHGEGYMLCCSD
jgi:DNA-binding response OmpR family regulator